LKEIICRRCGKPIIVTEELDDRYGRPRLRTFRFNPDGSPHWCEIKIGVSDKRLEWAKFNINELERCWFAVQLRGYRLKLHRLRHGYRTAKRIFRELRERLEYSKWRLKLIEKLLKIQWDKLWSVGTHNYHYRAVDNFFKWYKDYYETVYPQTSMAVQALNEALYRFYRHDRWKRSRVTEPLVLFNHQLDEILRIITLVRDVAVSDATKAEKNYWLRQITQATEWPRYSWIGYDSVPTWLGDETVRTLLLDYEKAIKETEERFQEAFKDRIADITGRRDHGFFIDGTFDHRIEEGIAYTFRKENPDGEA